MAAPGNINNLTTLIKRLEAATSRLEDIATSVDSSGPNGIVAAASTPGHTAAATEPQTSLTSAPQAKTPEPLPSSIEEFDALLGNEVQAFVDASSKVGGLVEEQAKAVQQAFDAERTFLLVTTKAKKPDHVPPELTADLHRHTSSVDEIKETNRPSPLFNHLTSVTEVITLLSWIMVAKPADHVTEALGGAQYYGNKVLKEYKEKDQAHVDFIQAYYKIYRSLAEYVKKNFPSGVTWNNKDGIDAMEALKQIQSGAETPKASAGGTSAPPPPPPLPNLNDGGAPPPPPPPPSGSGGTRAGGDMTAVFDQLNQGSAVTAGLRKVDKSEMTHKNPSLRASSTVPQRSDSQNSTTSSGRAKSPMPAKKPDSLKSKKPSKKELDGTKWIVEYFENTGSDVVEIQAELNHSILISRCQKCVIKIVGKANAISIDNCSGLSIMVESLVSSIDVIKATKFAVQVDGVLPTILLDQVDGGQIFLGKESMKSPPELFTSKCSSINVVVPPKSDDDDSKEEPLPEQIRTYFKDGKLVSEVVEHAG